MTINGFEITQEIIDKIMRKCKSSGEHLIWKDDSPRAVPATTISKNNTYTIVPIRRIFAVYYKGANPERKFKAMRTCSVRNCVAPDHIMVIPMED